MSESATIRLPLLRVSMRAAMVSACVVFVLALMFGGGTRQGFWSDALVQVCALPLLAWSLFRLPLVALNGSTPWALAMMCAIVAVPLVQLIPLPPALWGALPGRDMIASNYAAAGLSLPWMPISLNPNATWRAFLSLVPPVTIFLAVLAVGPALRRLLIVTVLMVAGLSVILDVLQMIGGIESGLRFFVVTNADRAVGFFANANHNAAYLYATVPFAAVALTVVVKSRHERRTMALVALTVLLAGIVMAIALTRSRAGILLGFVAGLSAIVLAWRLGEGAMRRRFLIIACAGLFVAILIAFQFGFSNLAQRAEEADLSKDLRWTIASATSRAALANLPFGSGVGTFVAQYDMYAPRESLQPKFVNRAHDDWLEAFLEGGVLSLTVAVFFLFWFACTGIAAWRVRYPNTDDLTALMPRSASVVIVLLLIHSAIDYPLRTTAITVMFALCCALLVPAGGEDWPSTKVRRPRGEMLDAQMS